MIIGEVFNFLNKFKKQWELTFILINLRITVAENICKNVRY